MMRTNIMNISYQFRNNIVLKSFIVWINQNLWEFIEPTTMWFINMWICTKIDKKQVSEVNDFHRPKVDQKATNNNKSAAFYISGYVNTAWC